MRWISNLFSRNWRNLHFLVVVVLSVVLGLQTLELNLRVSDLTLTLFYTPFFKIKHSISELVAVKDENDKLRESLIESTVRVGLLEEAARENIRLRSILGFEPPTGYSLLPVEVIAVTGSRIPTTTVLNRGSDVGIQVGEPIINEEGLLGRVISVSERYCTAQLLSDPANRVAVRVAESREMGIAKYSMSKGLIVDNVPTRGDVKPGDQIITSGLGGIYPPGLRVGTVIAVDHPELEPFSFIRLAPAADFNSLDELFVLRARGR